MNPYSSLPLNPMGHPQYPMYPEYPQYCADNFYTKPEPTSYMDPQLINPMINTLPVSNCYQYQQMYPTTIPTCEDPSMSGLTVPLGFALEHQQPGTSQPSLTSTPSTSSAGPSQEILQQVLDVSSTTNSPPRGSKRGRPTKNPCWSYFSRLDDDRVVRCNLCQKLVKSACATNMTKHLERHHTADDPVPYATYKAEQQWFTDGGEPMMLDTASRAPGGGNWSQNVIVPWNAAERRNAKRNRRTKHPVWELFRRTGEGAASCELCGAVVRSPCSSNFMGHLNRHHIDHYHVIYARWMQGRMAEAGVA